MSLNDPLANVLSALYNAEITGKSKIIAKPSSNLIKKMLTIMKKHGYIKEFNEVEDRRGNQLKITLSGKINRCGAIKPRYSIKKNGFERYEKRYLPAQGMGIIVVSTSSGLMTQDEAIKKGLGGKLIAYCY